MCNETREIKSRLLHLYHFVYVCMKNVDYVNRTSVSQPLHQGSRNFVEEGLGELGEQRPLDMRWPSHTQTSGNDDCLHKIKILNIPAWGVSRSLLLDEDLLAVCGC